MLQAPTNDRKTKADASAKTAEQLPEQEQSLQLLGGLGPDRQSQPLQQRNNLAGLQKTYGNQAVLRMKGRSPVANSMQGVLQRKCACGNAAGSSGICTGCQEKQGRSLQTKFKISEPGDEYEQEADRVAEQVMMMPDPAASSMQQGMTMGEQRENNIQTKPLATTIAPILQRQALSSIYSVQSKPSLQEARKEGNFEAGQTLENSLNNNGSGSPLPDDVRAFMEPRFGADFSQVRVHTGSDAVQMNRELNAQAFTHKQDVYFGAEKSPAKDALTAHELTHVMQQAGGIQSKKGSKQSDVQLKHATCDEEKSQIKQSLDFSSSPEMLQKDDNQTPTDAGARSCPPPSPGCPPDFCKPFATVQEAKDDRDFKKEPILLDIGRLNSRAVPLFEQYIDGGRPLQNISDKFAADFTNSTTTLATTQFLVMKLEAYFKDNLPSRPTDTFYLGEVLEQATIDQSRQKLRFTNYLEVPGLIAGGIGKDDSKSPCGAIPSTQDDDRLVDGTVTVMKNTDGTLNISPTITFTVIDTLDFCPGNCGGFFARTDSVPMSRWEATGISGDLPFTVQFPAPSLTEFPAPSLTGAFDDRVMTMADPTASSMEQMALQDKEVDIQTKSLVTSITPLLQREAIPEEESMQTKPVLFVQRQVDQLPEVLPLSKGEETILADAHFRKNWALLRALYELNSLVRAIRMRPDPNLLQSAFGATIAIINTWLDVGLGETAPEDSYLGQTSSDYFTDVVDVAIQHIRDNLSHKAPVDNLQVGLCTVPGVQAFYDSLSGSIHICSRAFATNIDYLGLVLIHEYFHAVGLVHGGQEPIEGIDLCVHSTTTETKLENPYCMTGLVEHIAYGNVWW